MIGGWIVKGDDLHLPQSSVSVGGSRRIDREKTMAMLETALNFRVTKRGVKVDAATKLWDYAYEYELQVVKGKGKIDEEELRKLVRLS
jgi:hypothetical protein